MYLTRVHFEEDIHYKGDCERCGREVMLRHPESPVECECGCVWLFVPQAVLVSGPAEVEGDDEPDQE